MTKLRIFSSFFIFLSFQLFSQEKTDLIQQRIEFIAEQAGQEEIDLTNILDQLNYYFEHPLNLNFASYEDLENLGLLNEFQIKNLLLHIQMNGKLIVIYELQSLKFWDLGTIQLLLPFVKVDDKLDQVHVGLKEALKYGDFETFTRFQTTIQNKHGSSAVPDSIKKQNSSYYWGNKDHYYARMRYSYRTNFSIGVTADKDPGEQFFKGSESTGFDFYSLHAFYKGGKYLKAIALGDYQIQIGQGLNVWSGYAFGKSSDVTNIKKSANPIRPYTSVDESRFMRGAAIDLGYKRFSLTSFASCKKIDATISSDTLANEIDYISSLQVTGLHRTSSEIARKNGILEKMIGANLRYRTRDFQLGIASIYQGYDRMYTKEFFPYNQFDFRGKDLISGCADYNWILKNVNFFGEIARSSNSFSQLHGVLIAVDPRVSVSALYRNYDRAYQTFYNYGFSEGSNTQNENGIYVGWKVRISNSLSFNSYMDFFAFPWLKYLVNQPSKGHEFLSQLTYKPTKTIEIYGRFREQLREKNSRNSDGTIAEIEEVVQRNYRFNLSCAISEAFTLKSRIEYVTIHRKSNLPENGIVIMQDIQFRPKSSPFDVSLRYVLFQTYSYDSRIYSFESNALYVYSIPAYYYQGSRACCMIRYSFLKNFDVWIKYGTNIYNNRKSIGTGLEEIKGNVKSDITIQLRMKL
jgi:hypothetical protein